MLDGHISTCFNKDSHDLFKLCILLVSRYVVYYLIIVIQFILLLFAYSFIFCSTFVSFDYFVRFNFSSFSVHEKIFNSDPELYSRYFNPVVQEVPVSGYISQCMQVK